MKKGHIPRPDRFIPKKGQHFFRLNISVTAGQIEELQPFLRKHDNNFSAAIREVIAIASIVQQGKVQIPRPGLKELMDEFYSKLLFYTEGQK